MRVSEQIAKTVVTDEPVIRTELGGVKTVLTGLKAQNGDCYAIIDRSVRPHTAMVLAAMEFIKAAALAGDDTDADVEAVIKDLFQGATVNSVQRRWVIFDVSNRPVFAVLDSVGDPFDTHDQFVTGRPVREDDEGAVLVTTVRLWHDA
jgi:hypothetical protein